MNKKTQKHPNIHQRRRRYLLFRRSRYDVRLGSTPTIDQTCPNKMANKPQQEQKDTENINKKTNKYKRPEHIPTKTQQIHQTYMETVKKYQKTLKPIPNKSQIYSNNNAKIHQHIYRHQKKYAKSSQKYTNIPKHIRKKTRKINPKYIKTRETYATSPKPILKISQTKNQKIHQEHIKALKNKNHKKKYIPNIKQAYPNKPTKNTLQKQKDKRTTQIRSKYTKNTKHVPPKTQTNKSEIHKDTKNHTKKPKSIPKKPKQIQIKTQKIPQTYIKIPKYSQHFRNIYQTYPKKRRKQYQKYIKQPTFRNIAQKIPKITPTYPNKDKKIHQKYMKTLNKYATHQNIYQK